jgi:NAD+ kinase
MNTPRAPIRRIVLIGRHRADPVRQVLEALATRIGLAGAQALIEAQTATDYGDAGLPVVHYAGIGRHADVALVVGGDGALLHAARALAPQQVPLAGVNLGRLGFMTDIARDHIDQAIGQLLAGEFRPEQRLMLRATVFRGEGNVFSTPALNDVVVSKGAWGRMIELRVDIDGEFLFVLRADGLIVSTPTGSTAYAMSAHGPILHPGVAGIAVVPLCPHALTYRPITISDHSQIRITLLSPYEGAIHCDGQEDFALHADDCIEITRMDCPAIFLHPPGYRYFAMLREKLHWSASPKY